MCVCARACVWLRRGKRRIRGLIKVTSECFISSKSASSTGNALSGSAERRSWADLAAESPPLRLSQYKPEAVQDSGVRPLLPPQPFFIYIYKPT